MPKRRIYYSEFRRTLESEPLKPVYLFTGAEHFLKEEGLQRVLDKALPPADRSLNLETLYAGADISGREVKERAQTIPFLASNRVVVVRQVEKWKPSDLSDLAGYLENPSPSTTLLLVSQEEKLKSSVWNELAAKAYHVECYPLFDNQVPEWIERRCRDYGKRIQREAVILLIERVGQALSDLDNELNKLANYIGNREQIAEADVKEAAGYTRQETLLELTAALGRRDAANALRLAERVLSEGISGPQILGAMGWHFRHLQNDRARLESGENLEQIVAGVRMPQAKRDRQEQIKAYDLQDYPRLFREFLKLDEHIKSGKTHWELALLLAVMKVCGKSVETAGNPGRN